MKPALKEPVLIGVDLARGKCQSTPYFIFTCSDCQHTEHSLFCDVPGGWDVIQSGSGVGSVLRCPDCNEAIEQKAIQTKAVARHHAGGFAVFLEKQSTGEFQIAMTPEDVLMRWLPLGFYLTPAQARALSADLISYAALAENPGSVPHGKGGVE